MNRLVTLMLIILCALPFDANAEDLINKRETLTLERCIEIALKMQPTMAAAVNTVTVNESRVGQAKSTYYPQINWSASYERIKTETGSSSNNVNSFLGRLDNDAYDRYATGFSLNQLIYDFGKTATQVKIQNLSLDASRSDLTNTTDQTVFAVDRHDRGIQHRRGPHRHHASLNEVRRVSGATLVVKRGPMGCAVVDGAFPRSLDEAVNGRGVTVEVLNVLGAGDAFNGGFLSGWLRGEDYDACARYANACGLSATSAGVAAADYPVNPVLTANNTATALAGCADTGVRLTWSAAPGMSRHHWGTDVDVYDRAAVPEDYAVQLVPAEYGYLSR